jgi:hypothetical protein
MMEHGDPKTFKEAMEGPDAELCWLTASGNEAMNLSSVNPGERSFVLKSGKKDVRQLAPSGCAKSRTCRMVRHSTRDGW